MEFAGSDILSVDQFGRPDVERVFEIATKLQMEETRGRIGEILRGKILGNLFFEPSTRTRMSFASAFMRLGGQVISSEGHEATSMAKGETLKDTIRAVQEYCDVITIRHPQVDAAAEAAGIARIPVINGGDGSGEHPTQALLDLFTVQKEQGKVDDLHFAFVGDLQFGRAVHSLCKTITLFNRMKIACIARDVFQMPDTIVEQSRSRGAHVSLTDNFEEGIKEVDVIYMTRLQQERFPDRADLRAMEQFVLTRNLIERTCKPAVTIMHPLPRLDEIASDVDDLEKNAAYLRQPHNGLFVRMALFLLTLDKTKELP